MTLKQKALAHYDRMIAWAEKQPKRGRASLYDMSEELNEHWNSDDCPYCQSIEDYPCETCSMFCESTNPSYRCCGGFWIQMDNAKTWGTWVKLARKVREYIEQHG